MLVGRIYGRGGRETGRLVICRAARGADVKSARVPAARFRSPKRHLGYLSGASQMLAVGSRLLPNRPNFAIASSRVAAVPFVAPFVTVHNSHCEAEYKRDGMQREDNRCLATRLPRRAPRAIDSRLDSANGPGDEEDHDHTEAGRDYDITEQFEHGRP